jgi:multiple sugar transport system substrate-binding protein
LLKINTINGKLYALPTFVQTPLMVYNKELLKKAGLQPPKTWEETLAVAKALHDKGKGIALPAKQGLAAVDIWIAMARSNNGNYFNPEGKLQLVTEPNIETVKYWKDLVTVANDPASIPGDVPHSTSRDGGDLCHAHSARVWIGDEPV